MWYMWQFLIANLTVKPFFLNSGDVRAGMHDMKQNFENLQNQQNETMESFQSQQKQILELLQRQLSGFF